MEYKNATNLCENPQEINNMPESVRKVSALPVCKDIVFLRETSGNFPLYQVIKMDSGYFKIWRKIRLHPIWSDPKCLSVFLYCLNHSEWDTSRKIVVNNKEFKLAPGQFTCGRKQIAKEMGLSEQMVRTALNKLSKTYEILTIKSTSKFSFVTILNWDRYQNNSKEKRIESTSTSTNNQPTTNHTGRIKEYNIKEYYSAWFEEIWLKYPKRVGKKMAKKHFDSTVKTKDDFDRLARALANYLSSKRVREGYIQNGATWLNNWEDWVDYKEEVCPRCKDKGSFVSATGYTILCDCAEGRKKS